MGTVAWTTARRGLAAAATGALLITCGCAKSPGGGVTGARLVVSLRFAGPVNPNYRYFFLIRNANDQTGLNGPIPVVEPPYGNGFATDLHPGSGTAAFTDFVEFGSQPTTSNYGVYHVVGGVAGNPNLGQFRLFGDPDNYRRPTDPGSDPQTLYFELSLGRLTAALATGEPDPNNGAAPRFLQVNLVATTTIPINPQARDPNKYVDAMGDQHLGSGSFNTVLTLDTAQTGRTYHNSASPGDPTYEPDNDTYPEQSDPGVELLAWSIQVVGQ